ncbi:hypothetical protein RJT34_13431 [Clitoria ternatea]|uniref:Uncharacterized protein n=1 Tax=Clitoria ternatea TaxID=43366 RepID=A0AAN9PLT3_CLITE
MMRVYHQLLGRVVIRPVMHDVAGRHLSNKFGRLESVGTAPLRRSHTDMLDRIGVSSEEDVTEVIRRLVDMEVRDKEWDKHFVEDSNGGCCQLLMKILSFNVKGLDRRLKKKMFRELVGREKVAFLGIQETKLHVVDNQLVSSLWNVLEFDWVALLAAGTIGGLLCVRNKNLFQRSLVFEGFGLLGVLGCWKGRQSPCVLLNVYSSCLLVEKTRLWEELIQLKLVHVECNTLG